MVSRLGTPRTLGSDVIAGEDVAVEGAVLTPGVLQALEVEVHPGMVRVMLDGEPLLDQGRPSGEEPGEPRHVATSLVLTTSSPTVLRTLTFAPMLPPGSQVPSARPSPAPIEVEQEMLPEMSRRPLDGGGGMRPLPTPPERPPRSGGEGPPRPRR
jgi:hypothetical protein